MAARNTLVRSLHDLGLAAWFGGTLMGAVGLNGATAKAKDPAEGSACPRLGGHDGRPSSWPRSWCTAPAGQG